MAKPVLIKKPQGKAPPKRKDTPKLFTAQAMSLDRATGKLTAIDAQGEVLEFFVTPGIVDKLIHGRV